MPRPTLPDRIDTALAGQPLAYGDLARKLWPDGPAWRCAVQGGPPGCYMALSAAIRRGRFHLESCQRGKSNAARRVFPRA